MVRLPGWSVLAATGRAVGSCSRTGAPTRWALRAPEPLESRALLSVSTPWVHAREGFGFPCGDPGLMVGEQAPAVQTAGNLATASGVGAKTSTIAHNGYVGFFDPVDMFRFDVAEDADVHLELTGLHSDLDLRVYDDYEGLIGISENPWSTDESLSGKLTAGTYYVEVYPYGLYDASTYRLAISASVAVPPPPPSPLPSAPSVPSAPAAGSQPEPSQPEPASESPAGEVLNAFPDVPYFGGTSDWNLNAINAPEVWAQGYTGEGIVVAVVDTGVDLGHSDLASNLWLNSDEIAGNGLDDDANGFVDDIHGWDFANGDNAPTDFNGHGTHVAGTIAAVNNGFGVTGVAPDAQIMPVQVLDLHGSAMPRDVAAGIRYAVDNGAEVVNLSLGGAAYDSAMRSALVYASQRGVFVVAAAGNAGGWGPDYPAQFGSSLPNVISAGAHDSNDRHAGFSNSVGSSGAVQVDAPGVDIRSTLANDQYAWFDGTSMAAPHVAGLAALALSANPNLSAADLRTLIVEGADRAIQNSDSLQGINAALTVALAARAV